MSVLTKLIITTCLSIMTGLSESKTSYDDSYYLAVEAPIHWVVLTKTSILPQIPL